MSTYLYPDNLKKKPMIGVWNVRDFVISVVLIIVGAMLSIAKIFFVLGGGIVYAILSARYGDRSIIDIIIIYAKYYKESQHYQWQYTDDIFVDCFDTSEIPNFKPKPLKERISFNIGKLIVFLIVMLCIALLVGLFGYFYKQRVERLAADTEALNIVFSDDTIYEYSNDYLDINNLVVATNGDYYESDISKVSLSSVGDKDITFTLYKDTVNGSISKDISTKITIVDTVAPIITLSGTDNLSVKVGDKLDISKLVAVSDPVDKSLKHSKSDELGCWWYETNLNLDKAGEYDVNVFAKDIHGNASKASFKVKVTAPKKAAPTPTPTPTPEETNNEGEG